MNPRGSHGPVGVSLKKTLRRVLGDTGWVELGFGGYYCALPCPYRRIATWYQSCERFAETARIVEGAPIQHFHGFQRDLTRFLSNRRGVQSG
jgi:hypothetical protein